ncbi:hypothetical protein ZHAS_00014287 [Anopheles sinensis]|uniref:Uncharacterized protein n=1 Tax=Anopheles sinensis TaxID=74873 RepID=A0A084W7V5_ANOSI|nr:hypothetical protein ZHAS_00014287 [Anopheles sinensis]
MKSRGKIKSRPVPHVKTRFAIVLQSILDGQNRLNGADEGSKQVAGRTAKGYSRGGVESESRSEEGDALANASEVNKLSTTSWCPSSGR